LKGLEIKGELKRKEPLSSHTYLRVGGEARYFLYVASMDDMRKSIEFCEGKGIPYYIIGNGSNVLFLDEGFKGLVMTTKRMNRILLEEDMIRAEAGASLLEIIKCCKDACLSGFESLTGVPGTIGGAVVMNAGAYGTEIGEFVSSISVLRGSEISHLEEFQFGYRYSTLKREIVLDVNLLLEKGNRKEIENRMEEISKKRRSRLPKIPSHIGTCGSVFKNPEGGHAGNLIEQAGLKGRRVGGALISMDHANYILTDPSATSEDVIELIRRVRDEVEKKFGVILETEVVIIGKEEETQI